MNTIKLADFLAHVLPGLRAKETTADGLKAAIAEYSKSTKIQDDSGAEVAVEVVAEKAAAAPVDVAAIVKSAVDAALAAAPKPVNKTLDVPDTVPATAKRYGSLKHIHGENSALKAYRFGMWCAAAMGQMFAKTFCANKGLMHVKAQSEGTNTAGGFLVPVEFDNMLIDLREQYGVFRRNARIVPMAGDTKSVPRRTGGLTAYFVGEGAAITDSTKGWDQVNLVAKKLGALAKYSNELPEDAVINIGDDLAGEIAWAFAQKEDQCGFLGDGTSTYGGIVGLSSAFDNLTATEANTAGIAIAAGATYASVTAANMMTLMGLLPRYAYGPNTKFYTSSTVNTAVLQRLSLAQGGSTAMEMINGVATPRFGGFPVEIVQVMPIVEATDQNCLYFGDLSKAAMFGDRRATTIDFSDSALNAFEQDQIAIRGTSRFDIVVHDVGNQSATASLRVPGPIVCLQLA